MNFWTFLDRNIEAIILGVLFFCSFGAVAVGAGAQGCSSHDRSQFETCLKSERSVDECKKLL